MNDKMFLLSRKRALENLPVGMKRAEKSGERQKSREGDEEEEEKEIASAQRERRRRQSEQ